MRIPGFDEMATKCHMHRVVVVVEKATEVMILFDGIPCSLYHWARDAVA
jgi:hypothetical protein